MTMTYLLLTEVSEIALMLALLLHRDPGLVDTIYWMAGLDGVALVMCESQFCTYAFRREPRGHTSWGLWQIDSEWWPQWRDDILCHMAQGAAILRACPGKTLHDRVAHYNGGEKPGKKAREWGMIVERKRDSLALYLWRRLR
jgi:hypothetical protein